MSTKDIRRVLNWMQHNRPEGTSQVVAAALAEVEAVEKAARVLEAESIGDRVYDVRDRAAEDDSFKGDTWEHPRVVAYGEAAQVIVNIAKDSK